tara:strand:+ start:939 stop:1055 length:117 start_codon:yes stop_codon:yes gene_type:complete
MIKEELETFKEKDRLNVLKAKDNRTKEEDDELDKLQHK